MRISASCLRGGRMLLMSTAAGMALLAAAGAHDVHIVGPARSSLRVVLGETAQSPTSAEAHLLLER